jgi:hypothetical protein
MPSQADLITMKQLTDLVLSLGPLILLSAAMFTVIVFMELGKRIAVDRPKKCRWCKRNLYYGYTYCHWCGAQVNDKEL